MAKMLQFPETYTCSVDASVCGGMLLGQTGLEDTGTQDRGDSPAGQPLQALAKDQYTPPQ